ncbi:bifunctional [glutamate--ammonia ligase]-adenylyl-L-tyrosine phosphorylase/[glutamate--ammonia-ligase] adenylyltransferase [Advenella mimigardefordensis]|uniref:Bifunctional glutamine synthetase adenylyltransferase/adenylyl-removing enzyme n=1 Tax=Advenella mimigardefordensis (strain DSM 17166 / LMG 22922 / DPN7) TaxID=1247726 RepID=W0PBR1_ADVMD|nr:bifunctional [glutamate--ammonia ligase]-adenylyl-L-tyrosine phosphorylase/[glutamate--ammonia-ligase] adenylyltransferase [Advenella mimigardefordensis]AHG64299.1 glutamate-ammonia-ligase adenylyltransferase [Advenella mimigardefordensis DPN7]
MNCIHSLQSAFSWSGYLRRRLNARPEIRQQILADAAEPVTSARIMQWSQELAVSLGAPATQVWDIAQCRVILRKLRSRLFDTLVVRDTGGDATLEEVTHAISFLADFAVGQAYRSVMHDMVDVHGTPIDPATGKPMEMIILGMGKLGGYELNVSSDIDLIMLYPEEGETTGRRPLSHHEFYGRLTRRMMPILSDQDADGQVFRTDLRLRPDGDAGPLAWSLDALENYLIAQGREWERYAWLKARIIHVQALEGSAPAPYEQQLESLRLPFIYRKYFDFDTLASLRQLRERIRQDWQRRALAKNGVDTVHNIKLGEGGIREIEFVVQLSQLIKGGRLPTIQEQCLIKALHAEVNAGLISPETGNRLEEAYRFLRRVEHFLQYREDEQTHLLPNDPDRMAALATVLGFTAADFTARLTAHRQFVADTFRDAFRIAGLNDDQSNGQQPQACDTEHRDERNLEDIIKQQFADHDPDDVEHRLEALLNNSRIRGLSNSSRARLEKLLPAVIQAAARTPLPNTACARLFDLIETIAQRSAYIALLAEFPDTLARVARIMAASPWAASYLTANPILLDSLIEWNSLMEPVNIAMTAELLNKELDACVLHDGTPDVEQQMNVMRDVQKQVSFQLLAQDLEGVLTVEKLADQLSGLADALLQESLQRVWPLVRPKQIPADDALYHMPKFAVIAYGKLGGKELGYASDLDLVLLFDDPGDYALEVYAKLGRRLSTWLSSMTSSGRLYEIDLRLRPDGDAGLLAVSVDTFEKYQREHAWVWEHQALTRARFSAGDPEIGKTFERIRRDILLQQRDPDKLKQEVIEMRARIRAGHPNKTELFDVKHDHGGMVDIEFITQYCVLAHAHQHKQLLENLGNIALLNIAGAAGILNAEHAGKTADSYRILRRMQHAVRLKGDEKARIDPSLLTEERAAVCTLWEEVFGENA